MNKTVVAIIFMIIGIHPVFADGPYFWGCIEWWYSPSGKFCHTPGYEQTRGVLDLCVGETETLYACNPSGSCTDRTYQWYEGYLKEVMPGVWFNYSGQISGAITNDFLVEEKNETRAYWCAVTYLGNTTNTDTVIVYFSPTDATIQPNISDLTACHNDHVNFSIHIDGHNNYQWQKSPDGFMWSDIPGNNINYYHFTATMDDNLYQYKCIASNACWGEDKYSNTATLTVNQLPDVSLGTDTHICQGSSLQLDAGNGMKTYDWNTTESTRTISVNTTGTYSVTVTNFNNCENSDDIVVTVDPELPDVDLGGDQRICLNDTVTLDAGPGYDHYSWTTFQTSQTIDVIETGDYSVEVSRDNNVCRESDTVHIEVAEPFSQEKICLVTIDRATGKNLIVWDKTPEAGIVKYKVYREKDTQIGEYELIDSLDIADLSVYLDTEVDPQTRSYLYKITVVDTCGNESDIESSKYHKPPFLQYVSAVGGINLDWSDYEVEDLDNIGLYLSSYMVYRGADSTGLGEYESVGSVTEFTDTDPNALLYKYYYRVAAILQAPCSPSSGKKADNSPYSHSLSNIEDNRLTQKPNNPPTDIQLDHTTIAENEPVQSLIGRFLATDPDDDDNHTFSLVSGEGDTDNSSFAISGDSLLSNISFDFETQSNFSIRIQCMDDGTNNLTLEKIFTILVNDVGGETGTEINNAENGLRIYPNPFNLITTIEFPNPEQSEYSFSVTDLAGRVVYVHGKINTCAIEFNRNDLPAGVYFIELRGDKIYRAKLVIE